MIKMNSYRKSRKLFSKNLPKGTNQEVSISLQKIGKEASEIRLPWNIVLSDFEEEIGRKLSDWEKEQIKKGYEQGE